MTGFLIDASRRRFCWVVWEKPFASECEYDYRNAADIRWKRTATQPWISWSRLLMWSRSTSALAPTLTGWNGRPLQRLYKCSGEQALFSEVSAVYFAGGTESELLTTTDFLNGKASFPIDCQLHTFEVVDRSQNNIEWCYPSGIILTTRWITYSKSRAFSLTDWFSAETIHTSWTALL